MKANPRRRARAKTPARVHKVVDTSLRQMEDVELIRRLTEPEAAFLFKNALVQDSAYASLTLGGRKRLHRLVAETMETVYAGRLDAYAAQLAQHYAESKDDAKTFEYALRAGNAAARVYANAEALTNYALALQVAAGANAEGLVQLYTRRGRMLELAGRYEDALANYDAMQVVARARDDAALELEALMLCATLLAVGARVRNWDQSSAVSHQALELARALGNRPAEARIYWNLLLANRFAQGGLPRAIDYGEQSIALAEQLDLRAQLALSLKDTCIAYMRAGQFAAVSDTAERATALLRELDDKPMLAEILGVKTLLHFGRGELEQAAADGAEAYAINRAIDNPLGENVNGSWRALVYRELGQLEHCVLLATKAITFFEQIGYADLLWDLGPAYGWIVGSLGAIAEGLAYTRRAHAAALLRAPELTALTNAVTARLLLLQGDTDGARAALGNAPQAPFEEYLHLFRAPSSAVLVMLTHGEIALAAGDPAYALETTKDLSALLEHSGFNLFVLEVFHLRAQALAAQHQLDAAESLLLNAQDRANTMHARWIEWQILATLVQVETARGKFADADSARTSAQRIVREIAQHTPHAYRVSFLDLPRVRELFQARPEMS